MQPDLSNQLLLKNQRRNQKKKLKLKIKEERKVKLKEVLQKIRLQR
jgi:hypothetical protein